MAYCVTADIQRALSHVTIDATSVPTATQVGGYINQVSAQMDGVLTGAGVTLPISDATKLLTLARIATDGVCAMVLRGLDTDQDRAVAFQELYDKALERIRTNPEEFSEAEMGAGFDGFVSTEDRHWHRDEAEW
jgi:hypothetical protein